MAAYYNEIEPFAAAWLRRLIAAGHIAAGEVDERSITEVSPDDLRGYDQCHFFAGIGGWSLALRLAGWPDDRPVWTGSCPCQPFSAAGKQGGSNDERHLWPAWFRLIQECRPVTVFGEQVAGAAGRAWLDHVLADLEGRDYAAAAAIVPACGVGAPHIRERLWFMADASRERQRADQSRSDCGEGQQLARTGARRDGGNDGATSRMADADRGRLSERGERNGNAAQPAVKSSLRDDASGCGLMGHADDTRTEGRRDDAREYAGQLPARAASPWRDLEWLACSDGKGRPTQPGLFPLANGVPGRVGRLRAYGNAIVPQVASQFIGAYLDIGRSKETR